MPIRVEVIIDDEGQTVIEVFGAHGLECEKITADLENSLGTVQKRSRKSEYYQRQQTQQQQAKN